MPNSTFTIGNLSKETGVKIVTIRYYEQIQLLAPPCRTSANYRAYNVDHLRTLRFIRRCRDLGFTLDQVRALLALSSRQDRSCSEVDQITAIHLVEIETKIADLTRLASELRRISHSCKSYRLIS